MKKNPVIEIKRKERRLKGKKQVVNQKKNPKKRKQKKKIYIIGLLGKVVKAIKQAKVKQVKAGQLLRKKRKIKNNVFL